MTTSTMSLSTSLFVLLYSVLLFGLLLPFVPLYLFILLIATFTTPQRFLLYLNYVNFPFFADFNAPETFGFPEKQVRNFSIVTDDNQRIGVWHIVPMQSYLRNAQKLLATEFDKDVKSLSPSDVYRSILLDRPVVLYFHGTAGNRAAPNRTDTYKRLAEILDLNVISIDYRGFGDSSGSPSEDGLAIDAMAIWKYSVSQGVQPENIILLGHSLGTGVATRLAYELQQLNIHPRALVLQAPYSSIPDVLFEYKMFERIHLLGPLQYFPAVQGYLQRSIVDKFDNKTRLKTLQCPLLITYGARDTEIPSHHSHRLFNSATTLHPDTTNDPASPTPVPFRSPSVVSPDSTARQRSVAKRARSVQSDDDATPPSVVERSTRNGKVGCDALRGGKKWEVVGEGAGAKAAGGGPSRVMMVELTHGTHNNVQTFESAYDGIRSIARL
ncbi:Alpha/Beta hydrolase protein [Cladochytrium replicatum]|nr:Alpha/Beta hydrolase protein [Cladochytrium replicatum]